MNLETEALILHNFGGIWNNIF